MSQISTLVAKRYRGALVGVLVGDCYGAPFERRSTKDPMEVLETINQMSETTDNVLTYTDDTSMTISTSRSLLENNGFDASQLAREYAESYFKEPKRGYGPAVRTVFNLLRASKYQDPFGPAANQFDGNGSYGNGAAMRCIGIALFAHKRKLNDQKTVELCDNCSRITHTHVYGINGAILLVIAAKLLLDTPEDELNESKFLEYLIQRMTAIEKPNDRVFTEKLKVISAVLEKLAIHGTDVTQNEIVDLLGNDVTAQNSVPLAIYSFLRGNSKFTDSYRIDNEFKRTLHWVLSCGGDTDTIGAMACGLAGLYFGIDRIPESLYNKCESYQELLSIADMFVES